MSREEREQHLWRLLEESRGRVLIGLVPIVRWLRERGESLSVADLNFLEQHLPGDPGRSWGVPPAVATILTELLRSREAVRVLNPAGGYGLLGAWLASELPLESMDVIDAREDAAELLAPLNLPRLFVHTGSIDNLKPKDDQYDAIVALPPTGRKRDVNWTNPITGSLLPVIDDPGLLSVFRAASRLSEDGVMALLVPPRFAWDDKPASIRRRLKLAGLYLTGMLQFRPGTVSLTGVAFSLAIIERIDRGPMFVAEVPDDIDGQRELVARFRERIEGPTATQGRVVREADFRGLAALEAEERLKKLVTNKGLRPIPFGDAISELRSPVRRKGTVIPCEEHPDAVYLPETGSSAATTRQASLPERLKSYFQLIVNRTIVLPDYLALMLNTSVGIAYRESLMIGASIPRITKSTLRNSMLYLPPITAQRDALAALDAINSLRSELAELESLVWERPRRVSDVLEAIDKVNHEERFEGWVESLPFPLASVLRAYHATDRTDKEKYERLLHFFEALAAFFAAIHLSAFRDNPVQWQPRREALADALSKEHLRFDRPTFGTWRIVMELLSKELRKLLNGKEDDQELARALYRVADHRPLQMLSDSKVVSAVQQANTWRNRWTGHGGAVGAAEAASRHEQLRRLLEDIRASVSTKFLQLQLIEPREMEVSPGPVFRCSIRRIMGSNAQFEHGTVELTSPAYTGKLYIHNPGHSQALELLSLVQVRNCPQPACYFFNRIEKSEARLVSYHFADQPEAADDAELARRLHADLTVLSQAAQE